MLLESTQRTNISSHTRQEPTSHPREVRTMARHRKKVTSLTPLVSSRAESATSDRSTIKPLAPAAQDRMLCLPYNQSEEGMDRDTIDGKQRKRPHFSTDSLTSLQKLIHCLGHLFVGILNFLASVSFTLTAIVAVIASLIFLNEEKELQSIIIKSGVGYYFIINPLLSTLSVSVTAQRQHWTNCLTSNTDRSRSLENGNKWQEQIIAASFLLSIICNQLPKWMITFFASFAVFGFGLASLKFATIPSNQLLQSSIINGALFDTSNDSTKTHTPMVSDQRKSFQKIWSRLTLKERAGFGTLAVVISLLLENFLIWVVSATYTPGIVGSPEPLQDNGRIVLEKLIMKLMNLGQPHLARRGLQTIRDRLNVQWALVTAVGASFVCLELKLDETSNRTLAGVALRALTTLASARLIRTISFVLTVLPSQVPYCYQKHFPKPPDAWKEWLMVGFLPNSRGGCNDLILSGHATVTSVLCCVATSVACNSKFSAAVWTLIALDYSIEAYQGLHYSVDMWLGCIITCLLWHLTKSLEREGDDEQLQNAQMKKANTINRVKQQQPIDVHVLGMYALPALLGFIVLTLVPKEIVNYFLVGYALWAGAIFASRGFTNFSQHILLCLLLVTLGVYL